MPNTSLSFDDLDIAAHFSHTANPPLSVLMSRIFLLGLCGASLLWQFILGEKFHTDIAVFSGSDSSMGK
jgi:hypothetical protein